MYLKSSHNINELHTVEPTTLMIIDKSIEDKGMGFKLIPLTEEWLVKLWPEYKDYGIKNNGDSVWFEYTSERYIEINHVHQLQNLYHSLTGEELTIK